MPFAPADAHEGTAGLDNVIDSVSPAMPGVSVQVVSTVVDEVVLDNPTPTVVTVLAFDGQPFLQIGPQGILANLSSPTWVASNTPGGITTQPSVGPPRWAKVSGGHSWGWFDPRLPPQDQPPPAGARPGVPITVASFTIPMQYGSTPVSVRGHLQYQPPSGGLIARLLIPPPAASGLTLSVLPGGPAPGFFASWSGSAVCTLLGADNEPFLRFGPFGVQANLASPTWIRVAQIGGHYAQGNGWSTVSPAPRLAWIDPRAAYGPGTPPVDVQDRPTPTDLVEWRLPIVYGAPGKRTTTATATGVTQWVPAPVASAPLVRALGTGRHNRPVLVPGVVAVALVAGVVIALGLLLSTRPRRPL